MTLGAVLSGDGCRFSVWAPAAREVAVRIGGRDHALSRDERGTWSGEVPRARAGDRYRFVAGGEARPDPASRWQPEGVHGPSAIVDPAAFAWTDAGFHAPALRELVIYELHIGTFTAEGTFDAAIRHFAPLRELGVTALEPLPVAQFPGGRNWGYDGVLPYAPQDSYGGPEGFRRFVDAAHAAGLAVILDVVYNHLGPEGNVLGAYGPYFTERYRTPWGPALNFDGADSDEVRRYFIENALMWLREHHVDGFRLDAIHAIADASAYPFLRELADVVHAEAARLGRAGYVIAESDQNDARVVAPAERGGLGHDALWSDDFHHSVHALLTGERAGYYADFGAVEQLATVLRRGWVYSGERSAYRRRRHGSPPDGIAAERFVVAVQNHDQVGNRMRGERLATLVDRERARLAAAALLLSPFTPLLFMGEEYGETRPFNYFVSHGDPGLVRAVREGRRAEFAEFAWQGEVPDPDAEATFRASVLSHADDAAAREMRALYGALLRARRELPELLDPDLRSAVVEVAGRVITITRARTRVVLDFGDGPPPLPGPGWRVRIDAGRALLLERAAADGIGIGRSGASAAEAAPRPRTLER